jgi:hypothetical protein
MLCQSQCQSPANSRLRSSVMYRSLLVATIKAGNLSGVRAGEP